MQKARLYDSNPAVQALVRSALKELDIEVETCRALDEVFREDARLYIISGDLSNEVLDKVEEYNEQVLYLAAKGQEIPNNIENILQKPFRKPELKESVERLLRPTFALRFSSPLLQSTVDLILRKHGARVHERGAVTVGTDGCDINIPKGSTYWELRTLFQAHFPLPPSPAPRPEPMSRQEQLRVAAKIGGSLFEQLALNEDVRGWDWETLGEIVQRETLRVCAEILPSSRRREE